MRRQRSRYLLVLPLITSFGGILIAAHITIFIVSTASFASPAEAETFVRLFGAGVVLIYLPGYFLSFGNFGCPAITRNLRDLSSTLRLLAGRLHLNDGFHLRTLAQLEHVPVDNTLSAFLFPFLVNLLVTVHAIWQGNYYNAAFLFISITFAIIMYAFFTYIIAEIFTAQLRGRVKNTLRKSAIDFEERSVASIKLKFAFALVFTLISLVEFWFMFRSGVHVDGALAWGYIGATVIILCGMLGLYFYSITGTLHSMQRAALHLGDGRNARFFSLSLDKEMIHLSRGLDLAAAEVISTRQNLEATIRAKTENLNTALNEMTRLKRQQDGDYFLTSLLLKPLSDFSIDGNRFKVDTTIRQFKRFAYRHHEGEIGGDLCYAEEISLGARPYLFFINADAMGKSLQGAGGVLVLGSALRALLSRGTENYSAGGTDTGAQWLRKTYRELNRLFEGFSGAMLISMAMGVIDSETGRLHYINAEHPFAVLMRKGEAKFLENERMVNQKLGMIDHTPKLIVVSYSLRPGDILILGSDGRDDVVIESESGKKVYADPARFLEIVQSSQGNIEMAFDLIHQSGLIQDDLSLMRIEYCGVSMACQPAEELTLAG